MPDSQHPVTTATITFETRDEATLLFGSRDQHLRAIREALPNLRLVARGDTLSIEGAEDQVQRVERVFAQLRQLLRNQKSLSPDDVRMVIDVVREGGEFQSPQAMPARDEARRSFVRPRTDGQARYVKAMQDNDLVFCVGPAGTGKTFLAVSMAVTLLRAGQVRRIVLVRPAVEAGERLGFLPGDIAAKVNPYLRPLFDALNDMMDPDQVRRYLDNDIIEIAPLAFMRGRTLNQAAIILDEGQNTTIPQMKMFLTRLGNGSKVIVTGDVTQLDLPKQTHSGLIDALDRLRAIDRIGLVYLSELDIVRHPLVQAIVRAYEDEKPRRKQ